MTTIELDVELAIRLGIIRLVCDVPLPDGGPCGSVMEHDEGTVYRCPRSYWDHQSRFDAGASLRIHGENA